MDKLLDDNKKPLPKKVQKRMDNFIESLKTYKWFVTSPDLKKSDVEKQAKFTLECLGIKAKIEYRKLETKENWDIKEGGNCAFGNITTFEFARASNWVSAFDSTFDFAFDFASDLASNFSKNSNWSFAITSDSKFAEVSDFDLASDFDSDFTRDFTPNFTWSFTWDFAWDFALASTEILLADNKEFQKKYPSGASKQLLKLWEMGLYPAGVFEENKNFVIYIPPCKLKFPFK